MIKRAAVPAMMILFAWCVAMPQSKSYKKYNQKVKSDYTDYRDSVYHQYQDFKTRILDHYADFLNGEWHEFEAVVVEKERLPNPDEPPVAPATSESQNITPVAVTLPEADFNPSVLPGLSKIPDIPARVKTIDLPDHDVKSNYEMAAYKIPDPGFAFGPYPGQLIAPLPSESWISVPEKSGDVKHENKNEKLVFGSDLGMFTFDFYGLNANVPDCSFEIDESLSDILRQSGDHWKKLDSQKNVLEASRQLFGLAQNMGLNGYLTYRLAEHYVMAKFPNATQTARLSTVHYLLSQMGYDARLALVDKSFTALLMPFDQKKVFRTPGLEIPSTGNTYYVLEPLGMDFSKIDLNHKQISRALLPAGYTGKTSDLRLTGLNIPMKPRPFSISAAGITLTGEVNENLMAMIYRYPQMLIGDYASSWLDNDLRKDIILQVKMQLMGLNETDAINKLMSFFHYGFQYMEDGPNHGFEKPYFVEENLYYAMNDCEDRAIFFSYLVWNVLDLPCQLIGYTNHESTAVSPTNDVSGHYYLRNGKKFFSADPTYIGSHFGEIHDKYLNENPTVDKVYE